MIPPLDGPAAAALGMALSASAKISALENKLRETGVLEKNSNQIKGAWEKFIMRRIRGIAEVLESQAIIHEIDKPDFVVYLCDATI